MNAYAIRQPRSGPSPLSPLAVREELERLLARELRGLLRLMRYTYSGHGEDTADRQALLHDDTRLAQDQIVALALRIVELGGEPEITPPAAAQVQPDDRTISRTTAEVLREFVIAKRSSAKSYRALIRDLGGSDPVTTRLLTRICAQKEWRARELARLLGNPSLR